MTAKTLAKMSADTMMKKFSAPDLPPKGHFHYHQGVFLSGILSTYHLTGDEKYFNYAREWVDSMLGDDGIPRDMITTEPDDLQPGVLLFDLYDKTGDEKYKKLLDKLVGWMMELKTNPLGGTWHKEVFDNQMWLDSMYMLGCLTSRYAQRYGTVEQQKFVHRQLVLMKEYTKDDETGLYFHAWDYSKKAEWADAVTGKSPTIWGRALGWFAVAMFEIAATLEKGSQMYNDYVSCGKELINNLLRYRDEKSGMWYQVVDKLGAEGNWLETSCSCLFLYAICLAVGLGEIDKESIREDAKRSFDGITASLTYGEDGYIGVSGVCVGTGVNEGTYEYYINRPTVENDLHGVGAFLLMACEYAKVFE